MYRIQRISLLGAVLLASHALSKEIDLNDKKHYLYFGDEEAEKYVHDYHPDKDAPDLHEPAFLFKPNNPARIVEFYAPWCPHCQHFRNHYVKFAKQLKILGVENDVEIQVYAVSCQAHKTLCQRFHVHGYPKVFLYKEGHITNSSIPVDYWSIHPFDVLRELGVQTDHLKLDQEAAPGAKHNPPSAAHGATTPFDQYPRTKENVYEDARHSLLFALKTGVFADAQQPLTNETRTALFEFLELVHYSVPPTWRPVQNLVTAILEDFVNATSSEEAFLAVVNLHDPRNEADEPWSPSCTKGNPHMGYTCGLWELFHMVTVGAVEWNLMLQTDDGDRAIATDDAAKAIRDFVEHFFGCEVCRTNFVSAYDSCFLDRCHRLTDEMTLEKWLQLPVWLWEMHNAVNVRLLKEKFERDKVGRVPSVEEEHSVMWPSRTDCPACWHADGGWDDMLIYKFLRLEYWYDRLDWHRDSGSVVALPRVLLTSCSRLERTGRRISSRRSIATLSLPQSWVMTRMKTA
jgi:thiol oxidase